ncbi:hypothetical protein CALVIDRAFT_600125 [Calocera viscosa TUFC12733]|uniref:NADH dehydrogenase [ubiquinone] 1 alpha subcomplex subunit n=1 Tax=Calocera viscosa (strain TUFC12733) TaxID=1330018 RepID=A0A167K2N0_CALVF|nr:hypothetical protein CALVIDRAFT_600125 [Calocera viscosa TUFC12733]
MLGFLKRVITWPWGKSRYLAGYDLQGNKFYEHPGRAALSGRTRRTVEYRKRLSHAEYVYEQRNLPVQWQAWLSRLRETPPSLEELQNERLRITQLRENVAQIEERERAASALAAPAQAPKEAPAVGSSAPQAPPQPRPQPATNRGDPVAQEAELRRKREEMNKSPLTGFRPMDPRLDEPVSWQPGATRRRGGTSPS